MRTHGPETYMSLRSVHPKIRSLTRCWSGTAGGVTPHPFDGGSERRPPACRSDECGTASTSRRAGRGRADRRCGRRRCSPGRSPRPASSTSGSPGTCRSDHARASTGADVPSPAAATSDGCSPSTRPSDEPGTAAGSDTPVRCTGATPWSCPTGASPYEGRRDATSAVSGRSGRRGSRIRTCDLRIMSPASYLCSTPQRSKTTKGTGPHSDGFPN